MTETEIYDGTCPECGGDIIEQTEEVKVGSRVQIERKKCSECGTEFEVRERRVKVVEWVPPAWPTDTKRW